MARSGYKEGRNRNNNEEAPRERIAILSRLNHKHLIRLIGFCQEGDEWLLVYEYMSNGTLHCLLHNREKIESSGRGGFILNSWKLRIKIVLDAARGMVEYAVPLILADDLHSLLDGRVEPPAMNEAGAVKAVAWMARWCVSLEGRDMPNNKEVVVELERALSGCEDKRPLLHRSGG